MPTLEQRVLIELLAGEISGEARLCEEELKTVDWAEVLKEAKAQAVPLMVSEAALKYRGYIPNYTDWENIAVAVHTANVRTAFEEQQLNNIMGDLPFIILKGMAAASYYPNPRQRSLGDIDFLIDPSQQSEIEDLLCEKGYQNWDRDHICHVVFKKGNAHLEMHFEIAGIPYGSAGETVRKFMTDSVKHSVTAKFDGWSFPAPEDIYHGVIILLHMQHHMLGEGLGLRHICDWACYIQKTHDKPFWNELLDLFQEIGILTYAKVVSKICSMYFHIGCPKWAKDADEELCNDVMNDVLTGGNFGRKDRARAKSGMMISNHGKNGTKQGKLSNIFITLNQATAEKHSIVKNLPFYIQFFIAILYLFILLGFIEKKEHL